MDIKHVNIQKGTELSEIAKIWKALCKDMELMLSLSVVKLERSGVTVFGYDDNIAFLMQGKLP